MIMKEWVNIKMELKMKQELETNVSLLKVKDICRNEVDPPSQQKKPIFENNHDLLRPVKKELGSNEFSFDDNSKFKRENSKQSH